MLSDPSDIHCFGLTFYDAEFKIFHEESESFDAANVEESSKSIAKLGIKDAGSLGVRLGSVKLQRSKIVLLIMTLIQSLKVF